MSKNSLILGACAAALLAAGSAQASVSIFYFPLGMNVDTPPGITQIDAFGLATAGTAPPPNAGDSPVNIAGVTSWKGDGYIQDASNSFGAQPAGTYTGIPALYTKGNAAGNFLTIPGDGTQGGETLTLVNPTNDYMQIYIGSLDTYNTLTFTLKDGETDSFNGTQLGTYSKGSDGNQVIGETNGYFTFLFSDPIASVNFDSSQNSFEIGEINVAPTPEPATWSLMILGVGLAGAALRLSKRNAGPLLAGV